MPSTQTDVHSVGRSDHQLLRVWEPITTSSDDPPYFEASDALGFRRSIGLRIYTPYDFALTSLGKFIVIDWKTGTRSAEAVEQARKQLASYCLWALSKGKVRRTIRVVPFFLVPGESWEPEAVTNAELDEVIATIEDHDTTELALLAAKSDSNGIVSGYRARREDFPASPNPSMCAGCRFLTVCGEGKKSLAT